MRKTSKKSWLGENWKHILQTNAIHLDLWSLKVKKAIVIFSNK